jgi:hypothetical protein
MKHLFNDIPQSEKQRILEMHGVKTNLISEDFKPSDFATGEIINCKNISSSATILWKVTDGGASHPSWLGVKLASGVDPKSYEAFISPGDIMTVLISGKTYKYKILGKKGGSSSKPKTKTPTKPTAPPKVSDECVQTPIAQKIFGGSKINLYRDSDQVGQPALAQVCVTDIKEISSDKLDPNFKQQPKGFILTTNQETSWNNNEKLKLFFVCKGVERNEENEMEEAEVYDYLINNNEKKVGEMLSAIIGEFDTFEHKLYQENVIALLRKEFCSTNKGGQFVPKVKNPKFASTDSQLGQDYV